MGGWKEGPPLDEAHGLLAGFYDPYEWLAVGVGDDDGRFYFVPQGNANCMVRLDPPYTAWFPMWCDPFNAMDEFGVAFTQGDHLIVIPQSGAGAARYDRTLDPGEDLTFTDTGPWEDVNGNYNVALPAGTTWQSILGGAGEVNNFYCAACKTSTGRIYHIGRRELDDVGDPEYQPFNYAGYLDPGAEHWTRIADLPSRDAGDPDLVAIEAHAACADSSGRVIVAGGLGSDGPIANFRRYTPGPAVEPGVVDIQRVEVTELGWGPGSEARVRLARDAFEGLYAAWFHGDSQAVIQAAFDGYFGAGVVTIAGTHESFTVTRTLPGVQPLLTNTPGAFGPSFDKGRCAVTSVQRGTGGPSVDAWEELEPLPVAAYAVTLVADGADIIALGGTDDGSTSAELAHRWREGAGWEALNALPDGYQLVSFHGTTGQAQPAFLHEGRVIVLAYQPDDELTALLAFDLTMGIWSRPIVCQVGHERGAFALAGGYAMVAEGYDAASAAVTTRFERFDLAELGNFSPLHLASLVHRTEA